LTKFEFNLGEFRGVLDPMDEIDVWLEFENATNMSEENMKMKMNAKIINGYFKDVKKHFE